MHQRPRPPPASPPLPTSTRASNPRESSAETNTGDTDSVSYDLRGLGIDEGTENETLARDTKLNQIIQNFFTKAALIILRSRCELPPCYAKGSQTKRVNKWVCCLWSLDSSSWSHKSTDATWTSIQALRNKRILGAVTNATTL